MIGGAVGIGLMLAGGPNQAPPCGDQSGAPGVSCEATQQRVGRRSPSRRAPAEATYADEPGPEGRAAAARRPALRWVAELGVGGLVATKADRAIHTVAGDLWGGLSFFQRTRLTLLGGLATTGSWGSITQLGEAFEPRRLAGRAAGIGPGFLMRFEPYRFARLSFGPELAGSLLVHDRRFPPGGDVYNFMWRLGFGLGIRLVGPAWLWLHGRWHHASNGQGLGPRNPSWEGAGGGLAVHLELGRAQPRSARP